MSGNVLPPPGTEALEEPEEFENGWDINVGSFLRMALEPGSVWTTKVPGGNGNNLIIRELVPEEKSVICDVVGVMGQVGTMKTRQTVNNLITHYNPPYLDFEFCGTIYGATCEKCNQQFEYQKKTAGFICWSCKNGY